MTAEQEAIERLREASEGEPMTLSWQQKKRIGEALGYHSWEWWGGLRNLSNKEGHWLWYASTEEKLWDAYQPDVLNEFIPWLERVSDGLVELRFRSRHGWRASALPPEKDRIQVDGDTFSEAVCALMLAILEATDEHLP